MRSRMCCARNLLVCTKTHLGLLAEHQSVQTDHRLLLAFAETTDLHKKEVDEEPAALSIFLHLSKKHRKLSRKKRWSFRMQHSRSLP